MTQLDANDRFVLGVLRIAITAIVIITLSGLWFVNDAEKAKLKTENTPHVCEVTSADLKQMMKVMDKKIAYRDMQIAGLQERARKKEGL